MSDGGGRWRRTLRRLRGLVAPDAAERELDDEVRHHLALEEEELVRRGMDRAEARREARRRFGGVERWKERARETRPTRWFEDLASDLRLALRTLRKAPAFTVSALLTLALGIGAVATVAGVVDAVLLEPLPYGQPERVLRVHMSWEGSPQADLSPAEYFDFRDRLRGFEALGVYAFGSVNVAGDGADPERLNGAYVSAGVLPALGVEPELGRDFTREEEAAGAPLAILSHGLWTRRFGADRGLVGRTVVLNDQAHEIVGVLPEGFRMPEDFASERPTDVLLPVGLRRTEVPDRGSHFLAAVGRVGPGMTADAGRLEVERVARAFVAEHPEEYHAEDRFRATALPVSRDVLGDIRAALLAFVGAVAFVILVVCANTAALLLARAEARRRDFALRAALGAGRGRIVRQVLAESGVLALVGGGLGLGLAWLATGALAAWAPPGIPRIAAASVSGVAALAALGAALLTGSVFGLLPAAEVVRGLAPDALHAGGRSGGGDARREGRARRLLVVAQVALALVLLAGAGLFTRSFRALMAQDPGFRVQGVLTARLHLPVARYEPAEVLDFYPSLLERLGSDPRVEAAGATFQAPLNRQGLGDMGLLVEGGDPDANKPAVDWQVATPGAFEAYGMQLLRGRTFTEADREDTPGVAVISESTARLLWPGEDEILGRRFQLGADAEPRWATVVGVVRDVRYAALDRSPRPQFYVPHRQFRFWNSGAVVRPMTLAIRTRTEPTAVADLLRQTVAGLDPGLPVTEIRTLESVRSRSVARPRFLMGLFLGFSALALVLAVVGIYGVVAHAVGRRTRELGIRMALGARSRQIVALVLREGAGLVAGGVVLGLLGAWALSRSVSGLLFEVRAGDPAVLGGVALLLAGVALAAALVPARRAGRTDPARTLRAE